MCFLMHLLVRCFGQEGLRLSPKGLWDGFVPRAPGRCVFPGAALWDLRPTLQVGQPRQYSLLMFVALFWIAINDINLSFNAFIIIIYLFLILFYVYWIVEPSFSLVFLHSFVLEGAAWMGTRPVPGWRWQTWKRRQRTSCCGRKPSPKSRLGLHPMGRSPQKDFS